MRSLIILGIALNALSATASLDYQSPLTAPSGLGASRLSSPSSIPIRPAMTPSGLTVQESMRREALGGTQIVPQVIPLGRPSKSEWLP